MKKLTFVGLCVLAQMCHAAEISTIEHFIDKGEVWPDQPATINRMEVDINGDGLSDIFLSSSQNAGAAGVNWVVYLRRADGKVSFFDRLFFHYSGFYFSKADSTVVVKLRASGTVEGFQRYSVTASGLTLLTAGYPPDADEESRLIDWQKNQRPVLVCAELRDLRAGTATWRKCDTKDPSTAYRALPAVVVE